MRPVLEMERVFGFMNLDEGEVDSCLQQANRAKARASHLNTNVDSLRRAMGWTRELSPWALRSIRRMRDALGETWELPGSGLPKQTLMASVGASVDAMVRGYGRVRSRVPLRKLFGLRPMGP